MELDDFKAAWQTLDARLARHERLQWQLLRERRLDGARSGLRRLMIGQGVQMLLGVALTALGVACWTRNTDVAGLLFAGIAVHAFGVLTAVMAGLTMGLAGTVDYAAPVVSIQKQLARLLRVHALNANLCGAPWWIMWVLVVVAVAGLGDAPASTGTPAWIWINLALGACGTLATWAWTARRSRIGDDPHRPRCDGADGIRRARRVLDEIAEFERG